MERKRIGTRDYLRRRYAEQRTETKIRPCIYCGKNVEQLARQRYPKCDTCLIAKQDERKTAKKQQDIARRAADPEKYARLDMKKRLKRIGLTLEWWDEQSKLCGICCTDDPGGKGAGKESGWAIDHDHSCCPYNKACNKCVRGLLCQLCNRGLGMFSDDPVRLRRAADWVERRK